MGIVFQIIYGKSYANGHSFPEDKQVKKKIIKLNL